jgi:hypothetical protein
MFEKNYMKIFVLGVLLLIVGIILVMSRTLYFVYEDIHDQDFYETYYTLLALSAFFIELGMLFFALSTFIGGLIDDSISPEVRRGLVFASAISIISLALIIIFSSLYF